MVVALLRLGAGAAHEGVEADGVDGGGVDLQQVAGRSGDDDVPARRTPERLAQAGDVDLQGVGRPVGRVVAPQPVRQPVQLLLEPQL
jgi:hypothetical protein